MEYRIIESLALNSGTVVTYQMLLEKIWGPYAEQNSRILRVNMTNIRKNRKFSFRTGVYYNDPAGRIPDVGESG